MVSDGIPERLTKESLARRRASQKKRSSKFIAGPIPFWWATTAASLPGKALAVALAVWFESRCYSGRPVRMGSGLLSKFHVSRQQSYRALKSLESAGLIKVERHRGRNPVVTVLKQKPKGK